MAFAGRWLVLPLSGQSRMSRESELQTPFFLLQYPTIHSPLCHVLTIVLFLLLLTLLDLLLQPKQRFFFVSRDTLGQRGKQGGGRKLYGETLGEHWLLLLFHGHLFLRTHLRIVFLSRVWQQAMIRTNRPYVQLIQAKRSCFLLVLFVEFCCDIVEILLQLEPMLIRNEQVLP